MGFCLNGRIRGNNWQFHFQPSHTVRRRHATASTHVFIQYIRPGLISCNLAIQDWCASKRLQLNSDKAEVTWVGSKTNFSKLLKEDITLNLGSVIINPSDAVRLDSELTMWSYINEISSTCFYRLQRLRQRRRFADRATMQRPVSAFIISRLDYCNSTLVRLPACVREMLQRALHAAVRFVADRQNK